MLPAAFTYAGSLASAASHAKSTGVKTIPQVAAANEIGELIVALRDGQATLVAALDKAESMHDDVQKQAKFLTSTGADSMAAVREASDAIELKIPDDLWPLPKYREMLIPV